MDTLTLSNIHPGKLHLLTAPADLGCRLATEFTARLALGGPVQPRCLSAPGATVGMPRIVEGVQVQGFGAPTTSAVEQGHAWTRSRHRRLYPTTVGHTNQITSPVFSLSRPPARLPIDLPGLRFAATSCAAPAVHLSVVPRIRGTMAPRCQDLALHQPIRPCRAGFTCMCRSVARNAAIATFSQYAFMKAIPVH